MSIINEALRLFPEDLVTISEALRIYDRLKDEQGALQLSVWALRGARLAIRREDAATAERMLEAMAPSRGVAAAAMVAAIRECAMDVRFRYPRESQAFWAHLKRIKPDDAEILHHHAESLIRCGRLDEAEREIAAALQRYPACDALVLDRGFLALRKNRFDEAMRDLRDVRECRPNDAFVEDLMAQAVLGKAHALLEAGGEAAAAAASAGERQDVGLVEDDGVRRLLLEFESVGQDCEFGLVQRRFGAEPLGLFRWNYCETDMLRRASDLAFDGIGDPEHTRMALWDDHEWYVRDERYGFGLHTWLSKYEADHDELFAKMCRRIGFMRRKFLTDLAAGEKVLVHKTFTSGVEEVRGLSASLRRHGPVRLVWVRSALADGVGAPRSGTVEEIEQGLYAAYVSQFGNRIGVPWDIAFDEWISICRAVAAA